jgi:flagellar protein FlaD
MEANTPDDGNMVLDDFELGNELSTLIAKNVIPSRIAEKLEQKLKEKEVKISKKQLYTLVDKIKDAMRTYAKFGSSSEENKGKKWESEGDTKVNENLQSLVANIEKLQERMSNIESRVLGETTKARDSSEINLTRGRQNEGEEASPVMVTTNDISVPQQKEMTAQVWQMDPLSEIPGDPESVIVLMKWLQYLIDKCGRTHLSKILDYYVDIGWITDDAKISLTDYSHGITEEVKENKDTPEEISDLPARDHIQSLLFIQKLKGKQFDKHFLERIDGELTRITKKLDNYHLT